MAKSIKPTLIVLAAISSPFIILGLVGLFSTDTLTLKNVVLAIVLPPLGAAVLVLSLRNNEHRYGVLSNEQKKKDYEQYSKQSDC